MASKSFSDLLKQFEELNKKIDRLGGTKFGEKTFKGFKDNLKDAEKFLSMMRKEAEALENTLGNISDEFRASVRELEGQLNVTKDIRKVFNSLDTVSRRLNEHKREESILTVKQLKDMKRKIELETEELKKVVQRFEAEGLIEKLLTKQGRIKKGISKTDEKTAKAYIEAVGHLKDNESALHRVNEEATKLLKIEKAINKTLGVTGAAFKGIQKTLGKIGIESEHFEKMNEDMREAAKSGSRLKVVGAGIKGAFAGISEALNDPVVLIGVIFKTLKAAYGILQQHYKEVSAIGQAYGVTAERAAELKEELVGATMAGGNLYMTMEEALKATKGMNDAIGMQVHHSKQNLQHYTDLVSFMGISEQTAQGLYSLSAATGQEFEKQNDLLIQQTAELDNQSGVSIGYRRIMDQVAGASATTFINFRGNTQEMIKSSHAAARLGMTIDSIMEATRQTLDFESSLNKEIEAEMFLQKDLNLDKLRYARMTGDASTVVEEQGRLLRENYDAVKDNAFAAESLAATLGMSVEDLHKYGKLQQQQGNKTLQQIKAEEDATAAKHAAAEKKAQEMERSFQAAMIQLKEALLPIIEKLAPVFSAFASAVGKFFASPVGKFVAQIAGLAVGGVLLFKAGKSILNLLTGGMFEKGSYLNPMYVKDVGGGVTDLLGGRGGSRIFKYFGKKGGFTRSMQRTFLKVFGKTKFSKALYNFTGKTGTFIRTLGGLSKSGAFSIGGGVQKLTQVVSGLKTGLVSTFTKVLPASLTAASTATTTARTASTATNLVRSASSPSGWRTATGQFAKAPTAVTKATSTGGKVMSGISKTVSKITPMLRTAGKVLGPVASVADLVIGGYTGATQADMTPEEQKAAGVREGMGKAEGIAKGILTGGAERGSMISGFVGIEKGSAADDAMGIAGAGARGAAIGATIGSVVPVVGTAIGGVVGGIVGAGAEAVKVFTDPNSALRQKVGQFGDWISEKSGQAWEGLKKGAGQWWEYQKKGWSKAWDFAKKGFSGLIDGAKSLWSGAKSLASKAVSGVKNLASKAWSGAKSVASKAWSGAKNLASKAWSGLTSLFAKGGIAPGGFRAFANGGVVDRPTIGLVGEGTMNEAVVPLPDGKNIPVNLNTQKLESLLMQLIQVTKNGSVIMMDGQKVGQTVASSSSEMGA